MNTIRTQYEYVVKRTIQTITIQDEIVAFKDVIAVGGKQEVTEGISTLRLIDGVYENVPVPLVENVDLYKSGMPEAHRQDNLFHDSDRFYQYCIEEPYSYLEANDAKEVTLVKMDHMSHDFYYLTVDANGELLVGERLPKPVYFDNANGLMSDSHYDIHAIYDKIGGRGDIVWKRHARNGTVFVDVYDGYGLEFRLIPTDEMWEKIKHMTDTFVLREYLKREVFDIQQFVLAEEFEEE